VTWVLDQDISGTLGNYIYQAMLEPVRTTLIKSCSSILWNEVRLSLDFYLVNRGTMLGILEYAGDIEAGENVVPSLRKVYDGVSCTMEEAYLGLPPAIPNKIGTLRTKICPTVTVPQQLNRVNRPFFWALGSNRHAISS
jgi:hypothetical protein